MQEDDELELRVGSTGSDGFLKRDLGKSVDDALDTLSNFMK